MTCPLSRRRSILTPRNLDTALRQRLRNGQLTKFLDDKIVRVG